DHDLGNVIDEAILILAQLMEFGPRRDALGIDVLNVILETFCIGRFAWFIARDHFHFARSQAAVEYLEFIDEAILEAGIPKPPGQSQLHFFDISITPRFAMQDVLEEMVTHDLSRKRFTIEIKMHTGSAAGAVVCNDQT